MADLELFPERFRAKVDVLPNECWRWTACKGPYGHGFFSWGRKQHHAHRWAWQWVHGQINDRRVHLDHFQYPEGGCIGPSCANPDHVRPATPRENTLRGRAPSAANLARTHCRRGHEFSPENTRYNRDGGRRCLACQRLREGWKGQLPAAERATCPQGHLYTDENTMLRPNGHRECRECKRRRLRERDAVARASATHCRRGLHLLAENLYITPGGRRWCRACNQERTRT